MPSQLLCNAPCVLCLAPLSSPPLPFQAEFHGWLTSNMESGNITRQEAVSMLPPLFLDVQPKHLVSLVSTEKMRWLYLLTSRPPWSTDFSRTGITLTCKKNFRVERGTAVSNQW